MNEIIIIIILLLSLLACQEQKQEANINSELRYVFYSNKQIEGIAEINNYNYNTAILEDSSIVVYTELTRTNKPSGTWDDYVYLGRGEWYKAHTFQVQIEWKDTK